MQKISKQFLLFLATLSFSFFPVQAKGGELNLKMIQKYFMFYPNSVYGLKSMKDGLHYTTLEQDKAVVKYSYETGEAVDTVFSLDWLEGDYELISSYSLSKNEDHILFATEEERIYRYSTRAMNYVYDLKEKKLSPVFGEKKQKFATMSPDGSKVAYTLDNNLYVKFLNNDSTAQLTSDGKINEIINGEPDWVYEEEFTLKTGYYWSQDSRKIAYYRFDESEVKQYNLLRFNDLYPELYTFKYPKAGEQNAQVDIYVYDLEKAESTLMNTGDNSDRYIPRIKWLPESSGLCITVLNRRQNIADLYFASAETGNSKIFYHEENEKYISEFTDDFVNFVGNTVLVMSEKSGFMHIYRYNLNGELMNAVTQGEWEVDELLAIDKEEEKLYYSSTEVSPLERHIYQINLDGSDKKKLPSAGGHSTAVFSENCAYYVHTWSDANTPPRTILFNEQGEKIRILEDNAWLSEMASRFNFGEKTFFQVENKDGLALNCYQILPHEFKKRKKYPVVVFVYGGPESQEVLNLWDSRELPWMQYLAQQGYVVVCMDNRGTDGRGEAFKKSTYMQLGKYETEDQIALAEHMAALPYVDPGRIGIFGWSYGGFMSLHCLTQASHLFNCGVAVAPVTNWKFYDSVYTERFMRKPEENQEGYEDNSPINYASQMNGKLLLIHGDEDDNVHMQNSIEMVEELVEHDKHFDLYYYPGQNHHMYNGNARYHLYVEVDQFFERHLKP